MAYPSTLKLGRLPSRQDARTLKLERYVTPRLSPPPDACYWSPPVNDWGVMGNDQYGNCVIVTAAHAILSCRANESADSHRITDSAVVALSREMGALDGYNILDRLNYWRLTGMWSNKIWAFTSVTPSNKTLVQQVIHEFGWIDLGLNMPRGWQDQAVWGTGTGRLWRPGTWGGHSVPAVDYDQDTLSVVTWGNLQRMSWAALSEYCDEAYAVIEPEWFANDAKSPSGFDLPTLHHDLFEVTQTPRHAKL